MDWVTKNKTQDDVEQYILQVSKRFAAQNALVFAIIYQDNIVGIVSFNEISAMSGSCSIGYWLAEEFQGFGLTSRSVSKLLEIAFEYFGMMRVSIRCAVENSKSRRIPERLGLTLEGILRSSEKINGRYLDQALYSMIQPEWIDRRTGKLGSTNRTSNMEPLS